jgi:hypothetical protein
MRWSAGHRDTVRPYESFVDVSHESERETADLFQQAMGPSSHSNVRNAHLHVS